MPYNSGKGPRKEKRQTADWWLKFLVWLAQHHRHSSRVKVRTKTDGQEMWLFSKTELTSHFQSPCHREGRNIVPVAVGLFSAGGYLATVKQVWLHLSMHCQPGSSLCFSGWGLGWNTALPSARASILSKRHLDSGVSLSPLSRETSVTSNVPVSFPCLSSAAPCVSPLTQVMHLLWPFPPQPNTGDHRSENLKAGRELINNLIRCPLQEGQAGVGVE